MTAKLHTFEVRFQCTPVRKAGKLRRVFQAFLTGRAKRQAASGVYVFCKIQCSKEGIA